MTERAELALPAALERLIANGTLEPNQADAVRNAFGTELESAATSGPQPRPSAAATPKPGQRDSPWSALLTEVGGYIGASFVVAAALALVGPNWEQFTQPVRVAVLAVPGALLLLAALAVGLIDGDSSRALAGLREAADGPRRRLVAVLVVAGGALLATTAAVLSDDHAERWGPPVALLIYAAGYWWSRGVILHLATAVALFWTSLTILDSYDNDRWLVSTLLLVAAGAVWAVLTARGLLAERTLGFAVAGVMAFIGGELASFTEAASLGYLILALLAVVGLFGYLRTRELSALGVGATALAVVVPQAVIDYTEGSLGAAGGLLVSGLSVVAASVLAARLRRAGADAALGTRSVPTELV